MVIGTDCTESCKSKYHTITTALPDIGNDAYSKLILQYYNNLFELRLKQRVCDNNNTTDATNVQLGLWWGSFCSTLISDVVFCLSVWHFFLWQLYCLSFSGLRLLIAALLSKAFLWQDSAQFSHDNYCINYSTKTSRSSKCNRKTYKGQCWISLPKMKKNKMHWLHLIILTANVNS